MLRSRATTRVVACTLILHLAHIPVPWSDGGEDTPHVGLNADEGPLDIDLLLLGVDPPDDIDEGPLDDDPEQCPCTFGYYFIVSQTGAAKVPSPAEISFRVVGSCGSVRACSLPHGGSERSSLCRSFSTTFTLLAPGAWRALLCVLLI